MNYRQYWNNFTYGFVSIAEGLVMILSLGIWYPCWTFHFVTSRELRRLKKLRDD